MATGEDHPAAHEVADAFVAQYFTVLQQAPDQAHRLYVEDSFVSRPGPDGTLISFKSIAAINDQILSYDYKRAEFEIISVDAQNSCENGIFVVVVGFLTEKDKSKRKFSQSFYLAAQKNVYVVLNDIFRYVDDEPSAPETAVMADPEPVKEATELADAPVQPDPVHEIEASVENKQNVDHEPSAPNTAEISDPEPVNEAIEPADDPVQEIKAPVENNQNVDDEPSAPKTAEISDPEPFNEAIEPADAPVHEIEVPVANTESGEGNSNIDPVSNGKVDLVEVISDASEKMAHPDVLTAHTKSLPETTKRSFASIVQSLAQNSAPFQVKASTVKPKRTAFKGSARVVDLEKKAEEPGTSIFVGNLPMTATPSQLHEIFRKFGPVKEDGIQVRSYKHKGVCFGFVAFVFASSVQDLLQAAKSSPFTLGDRKLRVKEKLAENNDGKPSDGNRGFFNGNRSAIGEGLKQSDGVNEHEKGGHQRNEETNNQKADRNGGAKIASQDQDTN